MCLFDMRASHNEAVISQRGLTYGSTRPAVFNTCEDGGFDFIMM